MSEVFEGRIRRRPAGLLLGGLLLFPALAAAGAPPVAVSPKVPEAPAAITEKLRKLDLEPNDKPAEAEELYRRKRAPVGETAIPVERYVAAMEKMRQMPRHSVAGRSFLPSRAELEAQGITAEFDAAGLGTWTSLGPGNVGGRTRVLVIDPRKPNTMFAAGVAGGVWKSTNAGATWRPLADLMANLAVSSLAMAPANSNVLYAGTGEGFFNFDAVRGAGIFKTTNGGATWTQLASTRNANFHAVNDLVVSPKNASRVYAATPTGVWRSLNAGGTWTRVLNPTVTGGCLDLAIRSDQATDFLFASCGSFEQATVWRNKKAEAAGGWAQVLRDSGMGRTSLAIAPSNQAIVYALAAHNSSGNFSQGLHAVFRSTKGGDPGSWTAQVRNTNPKKLNTLLLSNPVIASLAECGFGDGFFLNQGWYDNVIAVDPKDPNRVWTGGIDLFRSDDAGKNWGVVSFWWGEPGVDPSTVHADQHALVFHPGYNGTTNKTLYVGNDGGIFRTNNARGPRATTLAGLCNSSAVLTPWTDLNNGYGVTQFYDGAPYPDGETYFGGTQDNGTVRGNGAAGPNAWETILGGDGGYVAVDPTNTDVLYAENTGISIQKSIDGGLGFTDATVGILDPGFLFIAPFLMDPGNPQRLWTGGFNIWRTTNGAATWTKASTFVAGPNESVVSALAAAPTDGNRVLVGLSEGFIHRNSVALSADAGTNWPFVQPREGFVSSLAFDPANANVAYATYSNFGGQHVWRTTDGGATWSPIDGAGASRIPDLPVHAIVVDPADGQRLFVGTDLGVFISEDGGAHWAVENTGFANVVTESLDIQTGPGGSRTLFAFTHGRGAWRVTIED